MEGMQRPEPVVLPDSAMIPAGNLISPPPDHFTHEIVRTAAFRFHADGDSPDGELSAGTRVLLVSTEGPRSRVVDARGLCVEVDSSVLEKR